MNDYRQTGENGSGQNQPLDTTADRAADKFKESDHCVSVINPEAH